MLRMILIMTGALALLCPRAVGARDFEIEDLLSLQSYGAVVFVRDGAVLVERRKQYRSAPDFGYGGFFNDRMLGRVLVATRSVGYRLRPLFPHATDAGYWLGAISPDRRRAVVFRLQRRVLSFGIADIRRRTVRWSTIVPELSPGVPSPLWLDDRRLIVVARDDGGLPLQLRAGSASLTELRRLYARQSSGQASVTAISSREGPEASVRNTVLELEVDRSRLRPLFDGHVLRLLPSRGGEAIAILTASGPAGPPASPISVAFRAMQTSLSIVEVATGRRRLLARSLAGAEVAWSDDCRLLFAALPTDRLRQGWARAQLASCGRGVPQVDLGPVTTSPGPAPHLAWAGSRPVAQVSEGGLSRWRELRSGRELFPAFRGGIDRVGVTRREALFLSGGRLLVADGRAARLVRSGVTRVGVVALDPFSAADGPSAPPPILVAMGSRRQVRVEDLEGRLIGTLPANADLLAVDSASLVYRTVSDDGREALWIARADGVRHVLDRINRGLAGITLPRAWPIRAGRESGAMHWLVVPRRPHGRLPPLVIQPYPGRIFGEARPRDARVSRVQFATNALLLATAGFAVLLPSMPASPQAASWARRIPELVDEAEASACATGKVDCTRVAIMGHSFGGYAAMILGTARARYAAVVAANGISDVAAFHGAIAGPDRVSSELGLPFAASAGWAEGGQARLGVRPSEDPSRYLEASPIWRVDAVRAPMLLVSGDVDPVEQSQSERMFMELARAGHDVTLARYWGEGHTVSSAGNLRDYWKRVLAFLSRHLEVPPARSERARSTR